MTYFWHHHYAIAAWSLRNNLVIMALSLRNHYALWNETNLKCRSTLSNERHCLSDNFVLICGAGDWTTWPYSSHAGTVHPMVGRPAESSVRTRDAISCISCCVSTEILKLLKLARGEFFILPWPRKLWTVFKMLPTNQSARIKLKTFLRDCQLGNWFESLWLTKWQNSSDLCNSILVECSWLDSPDAPSVRSTPFICVNDCDRTNSGLVFISGKVAPFFRDPFLLLIKLGRLYQI